MLRSTIAPWPTGADPAPWTDPRQGDARAAMLAAGVPQERIRAAVPGADLPSTGKPLRAALDALPGGLAAAAGAGYISDRLIKEVEDG